MRYATLCSGGKDSILAHHVAHMWGWEPVGVLTVRPDDPESHLYHVPNLDLVALQAESLGLPLHECRAPADAATEWSVLTDAFRHAKAAWGADTIVTGAVASEYQRVRVERAGHEAGVKTHHPLWHKTPAAILDTLVAGGFDVRFSRAAAEGLTEAWLGARLDADARDRLLALGEQYRLHAAGEGGEFESVVLDAPLFTRRIEVTASRKTWRRDAGDWTIEAARLV